MIIVNEWFIPQREVDPTLVVIHLAGTIKWSIMPLQFNYVIQLALSVGTFLANSAVEI